MVIRKNYFRALVILSLWGFLAEAATEFRVEFSKNTAYVGELVTCNFVLYSELDALEIEVAKFPEFRGFWKENTVLRQGPVMTTPNSRGKNSVLVGSYTLIPILGAKEWLVEPMKLVIKNSSLNRIEGSRPSDYLLSSGSSLKVQSLPTIPSSIAAMAFQGAVGRFNFQSGETAAFIKDEPTVVRLVLFGTGNFPDINTIALAFPPEVEVISKRSYTQGQFTLTHKTFEYGVLIHRKESFEIPPSPFVYFDPESRKYASLNTPKISMEAQALSPRSTEETQQALPFRPFPTSTSKATQAHLNPILWLLNLLTLFFFGTNVRRLLKEKSALKERSLRKKSKTSSVQLKTELERTFAAKDWDSFIRLTQDFAFTRLNELIKVNPPPADRYSLIREAKLHLSCEVIGQFEFLFNGYDQVLFAPHKPALEWGKVLETIRQIP